MTSLELRKLSFVVIGVYVLIVLFSTLQIARPIGPIVGGDVYRHIGTTIGIEKGNPLWNDPYYAGSVTWYPWLFYLLIAGIHKIIGVSILTIFQYWAVIPMLFAGIGFYLLGREMFNEWVGLLSVILLGFFTLPDSISMVTTKTTWAAMFPFLLLYTYKALSSYHRRDIIIAGLLTGAFALMHLFNIISFAVLFAYLFLLAVTKQATRNDVKAVVLIVLIGAFLAMFFWAPNIAAYKFHFEESAFVERMLPTHAPSFFSRISGVFYGFLTPRYILPVYLAFFGIYLMCRKMGRKDIYLLSWFFIPTLLFFHDYLTMPLFNLQFLPGYFFRFVSLVYPVVAAFGIYSFIKALKLGSIRASLRLLIVCSVLFLFGTYFTYTTIFTDQWQKNGANPLHPVFVETADWFNANTHYSDVLLASPEMGFSIHALTGNYLIATLVGHTNPFVPYEPRYLAVNEAYTTTDMQKFDEIAAEYGIKYVLIGPFEMQNYYETNSSGLSKFSDTTRFERVYSYKEKDQAGNEQELLHVFKIV